MLEVQPRWLASTVDPYGDGSSGTCQVRGELSTPYEGTTLTNGALFTITANGESLNLQALELSTGTNDIETLQPNLKVLARKGTTISGNINDWIEIASMTALPSPDGSGVVVPRTMFPTSFPIGAGEVWMILVTFSSAEILQIQQTTDTIGTVSEEDDYLKINVGQTIGQGDNPLSGMGTSSIVFQGRIHYRVLKACDSLVYATKLSFPVAVKSGTDPMALKNSIFDIFSNVVQDVASLQRWTEVYSLALDIVDLEAKGGADNCRQYGFASECDQFSSTVSFVHHESLNTRDLQVGLLGSLPFEDNHMPVISINGLDIAYTGMDVLKEDFEMDIMGLSLDTIFSPLQREYLGRVIYKYLETNSKVHPFRVEVSQTVRRRLRSTRQLAGKLSTVAMVYGMGDDTKEFQNAIYTAVKNEKSQFVRDIQRRHYLPDPINDDSDLGTIFDNVVDVTWRPKLSSESNALGGGGGGGQGDDGGMSKGQIQIFLFSITLCLSFLILLYRFLTDFVLFQKGHHVENKKSPNKASEDEEIPTRPELANMDKPRQGPSVPIDLKNLAGFDRRKPPSIKDDASQRSDKSDRSGRGDGSNPSSGRTSFRAQRGSQEEESSRTDSLDESVRKPSSLRLPGFQAINSFFENGTTRKRSGSMDLDETPESSRSYTMSGDGSNRDRSSPKGAPLRISKSASMGDPSPSPAPRRRSIRLDVNDDDKSSHSNKSNRDSSARSKQSQNERGLIRSKSADHSGFFVDRNKSPQTDVPAASSKQAESKGSRHGTQLSPVKESLTMSGEQKDKIPKMKLPSTKSKAGKDPKKPPSKVGMVVKPKPSLDNSVRSSVDGDGVARVAPKTIKKSKKGEKAETTKVSKKKGKTEKVKNQAKTEEPAKPKKQPSPNRVDMTGATYI